MDIPNWPQADQRELELLQKVLASGQWGGFNEMVPCFEKLFARFQHCDFGVSAFNGTVTLETALAVAGIGPGDEVIVPSISFVSTATAVSRVGAIPVFVDIEEYSFNIDPNCVERAISPRTRAILAVHFGGPLCEIEALAEIAARRGLILFEDAAHAHGSDWNGKRAGSFGMAGSFSFQNGKVMTSGEGGLLTSNSEEFAAEARSFINQGRRAGENYFFHYSLGTNFRMTALQAAVLTAQLERLPGQIAIRSANACRLRTALETVEGLTFQKVPQQVKAHSHYLLCGRIHAGRFGRTRDEFYRALTARGIPCTPFYPHTLQNNPLYLSSPCRVEPCPNAEACVQDAFWFPHRLLLAGSDAIDEVAQTILDLAHRS